MRHCRKQRLGSNGLLRKWPMVFTALMIILPKCPFCIMAYTGAISLCSGTKMATQLPNWTVYLIIGFGIVIILGLLLNYRDMRTILALCMAIAGMTLVVGSQFIWLTEWIYYLGVSLLFIGIWTNGSLFYLCARITKYIRINIIDQLNPVYDS